MLGAILAALSAASFGLNNAMTRRGVLTGSVGQALAIGVPIGVPMFFLFALLERRARRDRDVPARRPAGHGGDRRPAFHLRPLLQLSLGQGDGRKPLRSGGAAQPDRVAVPRHHRATGGPHPAARRRHRAGDPRPGADAPLRRGAGGAHRRGRGGGRPFGRRRAATVPAALHRRLPVRPAGGRLLRRDADPDPHRGRARRPRRQHGGRAPLLLRRHRGDRADDAVAGAIASRAVDRSGAGQMVRRLRRAGDGVAGVLLPGAGGRAGVGGDADPAIAPRLPLSAGAG